MSTVHIHIGQCGNQLSEPLWNKFVKYEENEGRKLFTSFDNKYRSLHIDSESKVVTGLPNHFKIRESNIVLGKKGRGTNFALGYHGVQTHGDDHLLDHAMEALRKEVERCDMYTGAVVYHSLSGGTGSGLGSHFIELLRDFYPCGHILSCAVSPCASGESPLQNYNTLLALHYLHSFTDAIILLQNDFYLEYLNNNRQSSDSESRSNQVSFRNVNDIIADSLCGVFLPTTNLYKGKEMCTGQEPWEVVKSTTPIPSAKFITLGHHASAKLSWEGITSKVLQNFPRYSASGSLHSCLAATVVGRGDKDNLFLHSSLDKKIEKSLNCVKWSPFPTDFWSAKENYIGPKNSCSVTLAANSSTVLDTLERVRFQSLLKLESRAYVHWYERHGVSQDQFDESIESLQSIMESYKGLIRD